MTQALNLANFANNLNTAGATSNAGLQNSTISGVALGSNLNTLTIGTGLSGSSYNGSSAVTIANTGVTSVTGAGTVTVSSSTGGVTITGTDYLTKTTGSAPYYGSRAWAYWSSGGTINGSANVSSITVNGTGNYTVNFTTAMPDTNYSGVASTGDSGGRGVNNAKVNDGVGSLSASNVNITTVNQSGTSVSNSYNYVAVFR